MNFVLHLPDVNECEMLSGICGEALCENVEGSFLCLCSDENQEFDSMTGQCRFHSSPGNVLLSLNADFGQQYVTNGLPAKCREGDGYEISKEIKSISALLQVNDSL